MAAAPLHLWFVSFGRFGRECERRVCLTYISQSVDRRLYLFDIDLQTSKPLINHSTHAQQMAIEPIYNGFATKPTSQYQASGKTRFYAVGRVPQIEQCLAMSSR